MKKLVKVLEEISKLPSIDKKLILDLNTFQLEVFSKITKEKKINLERSKNRKKGYKYSNQEQKMYEKNEKIIMQICEESSKKSSIINITKKNEKKDLKKIVNEIKKFYE